MEATAVAVTVPDNATVAEVAPPPSMVTFDGPYEVAGKLDIRRAYAVWAPNVPEEYA